MITSIWRKKAVRETLLTVLLAVIFLLALRSVVHASVVDGVSMDPTLDHGQRIIVSKVAYWFDDPNRGDIVIFHKASRNHDVIHRIVGMPGETAEIKAGVVYINGQKLDEPYAQGNVISESAHLLAENEYLIVGDNRYASAVDVVPEGDIIGKAWIRYWPVGDWGMAPNHSF